MLGLAGPRKIVALAAMWRNQWKAPAQLAALQSKKLQRLVRHACREFPYYTALFQEAGIDPAEVRSIADLAPLPTSTKVNLRARLKPVGGKGLAVVRTSGSTGAPWEILYSRLDNAIANISWLRPQFAHGFYPWHRRFEISGPHNVNQPKRWYQRVGLLRRDGVSIFEEPAVWLSELARREPDVVWGYSGSLRILARVDRG